MSTLLSIVQAVQDEIGLPRASAVASASTQTERQMLALLNREGAALVKACEWPILITSTTITTVSGTSDYAVPAAFDRMVDSTQWDRTNGWEIIGPDTPQIDRWQRDSGTAATGPRKRFRYIGGSVRIWPEPTVNGETLGYEYVSKYWCTTSGGAGKAAMTIDTDVALLDEELLKLGLKYRFLNAKGLDASVAKVEYDVHKNVVMGADKGGGPLNMEGAADNQLVDMGNVPDSGYGV